MNAIKQALHTMVLELLKDAGYQADVEMRDGPSAGLYAVCLSKDKYHCQFIVRSRDSLFEVTHHANLRVAEFKAYLAMREPVAEAEALLNFLKTWIKWASGGDGAPNPVGYHQKHGLCYAAMCYERWKRLPEHTVTNALSELLRETLPHYRPEEGKDTPFNTSPQDYTDEGKTMQSHRNARRQAWVAAMINKLEAQ